MNARGKKKMLKKEGGLESKAGGNEKVWRGKGRLRAKVMAIGKIRRIHASIEKKGLAQKRIGKEPKPPPKQGGGLPGRKLWATGVPKQLGKGKLAARGSLGGGKRYRPRRT